MKNLGYILRRYNHPYKYSYSTPSSHITPAVASFPYLDRNALIKSDKSVFDPSITWQSETTSIDLETPSVSVLSEESANGSSLAEVMKSVSFIQSRHPFSLLGNPKKTEEVDTGNTFSSDNTTNKSDSNSNSSSSNLKGYSSGNIVNEPTSALDNILNPNNSHTYSRFVYKHSQPSSGSNSNTSTASNFGFEDTRLHFFQYDVYKPSSKFKKTEPGQPAFRIVVSRLV